MENKTTNSTLDSDCRKCQSHLPDLLFDDRYEMANLTTVNHLRSCIVCSTELAELRSTISLLDEFTVPELSPYFDSKLHARLREAQAAEPESLWERARSFLLFSTGRSFRPAVAGALAFALIAGGASFAGLHGIPSGSPASLSSTVNDLKVLDNNEPAEQQMGQLLDQSGSEDEDAQSIS